MQTLCPHLTASKQLIAESRERQTGRLQRQISEVNDSSRHQIPSQLCPRQPITHLPVPSLWLQPVVLILQHQQRLSRFSTSFGVTVGLRGLWRFLTHRWEGAEPSGINEARAKRGGLLCQTCAHVLAYALSHSDIAGGVPGRAPPCGEWCKAQQSMPLNCLLEVTALMLLTGGFCSCKARRQGG